MIDIRLLGGFSVAAEGRALMPSTRKAAALLAYLAHRPGVAQPRARLADLLWPRSPEVQARTSLRQALAQLRRDLAPAGELPIEARGDTLRLLPEGATVDVVALEAVLDGEPTPEDAERAAALYRGDFLDGFGPDEEPFEEWRRAEAARLRGRTLHALGRLLDRLVATGEVEAALAVGERLLALEPTTEEAHQALIRLQLDRGALGAAMRQYERCRDALSTELGVPPSAETEALRRRIQARPARPRMEELGAAEPEDGAALPTLAVLPFANLSEDPSRAWFARGFAEDLSGELSRFRSLRVISAFSSFIPDPAAPLKETARQLGARYLLTGSVRRGAESLRLAAELVDAEAGRQLWTQRYDVPLDGLFEAQDSIAASVAAALALRIEGDQLHHARRKAPGDLRAYECWLRGIALLRTASPDSHAEARLLFGRALQLDPGFARAEAGLSLSWFNEWSCLSWHRWEETEAAAFEHARRAVALDETDHVAQFILGRVLLYRRDFARGDHHLTRAEALNPNDADMLVQFALARSYLGEPERGLAAGRLAMRLNPFHDEWYFAYLAVALFYLRRPAEALAAAARSPEIAVDMAAYRAAAHAHLGEREEAERQLARFLEVFRRHVAPGEETAPTEILDWLLRVNPLQREEDQAYLVEGLRLAGLPAKLPPPRPGRESTAGLKPPRASRSPAG